MAYCEHCDHCNADIIDGDFLRGRRLGMNVSLRRAAADIGITPSYLSDIERNRRFIQVHSGIGPSILDYLGVSRKAP